MARHVAGCIALLALFAAVTAVSLPYMTALEPGLRYALTPIGAGLLTLGLVSFANLAAGYGRGKGSLRGMVERARRGEAPHDGAPMVATGRVRALASPLTAPLSGIACVGYQYRMYYNRPGHDGGTVAEAVYWGAAARPFALHSSVELVRVLAVPLLTIEPQVHRTESAVQRAREWVRSTRFEPAGAGPVGKLRAGFDMIRDAFTDEDGEARHDWQRQDDARDPADLILEETVLPVDEEASVHGTWSASRAAMVAAGSSSAPTVTVVLGPPEGLSGKAGLHSFASYLISATLMTAAGAGILWFGAHGVPGQR